MTQEMFMAHISDMRYKPHELKVISTVYELGELVHTKERRADGKFYWQHPLEVALSTVATQRALGFRSARSTALALGHDVGETVLRAFYHMHEMSDQTDDTDIFVLGNFKKIAFLTSVLKGLDETLFEEMEKISKSRNVNEKKKYFPSLTSCDSIPVLFTKVKDRTNNAETFDKIPESKKRKVEETLTFFPLILARLNGLVEKGVSRKELSENWLELPSHLHEELASVMRNYVTNFPKLF